MNISEVMAIDQIERQLTDEACFKVGEPGEPVEPNELLFEIERAIQQRRFAFESMAMWERIGDQDARAGKKERAEGCLLNVRRDAQRIAELEAEIGGLCALAAEQFKPKAVAAGKETR